MFKELGSMINLMKNASKLKDGLGEFQQKIGEITAEGDAGGKMVTVSVNGRMEVLRCSIVPELITLQDKEMLEDMIAVATNAALAKVKILVAEQSQKLASELGLPSMGGMGGL